MPDRARLLALAEECEGAAGPSLDLFKRAWAAIYPDSIAGDLSRFCDLLAAEAWLDAAVSLVPKEHDWIIYNVNGYIGGTPYAQVGASVTAFAAIPALAVTAAALRVLAEEAT